MTHSSSAMRCQSRRTLVPFKSQAQMRFMFAKYPKMAKEWASKTPAPKALPEKVKKAK